VSNTVYTHKVKIEIKVLRRRFFVALKKYVPQSFFMNQKVTSTDFYLIYGIYLALKKGRMWSFFEQRV
jgi:hypothetical protein